MRGRILNFRRTFKNVFGTTLACRSILTLNCKTDFSRSQLIRLQKARFSLNKSRKEYFIKETKQNKTKGRHKRDVYFFRKALGLSSEAVFRVSRIAVKINNRQKTIQFILSEGNEWAGVDRLMVSKCIS